MITTAEISITEYSEDLNLPIDATNDGKHGIVHPQILTPEILIQELRIPEEVNNQKYLIKLLLENYQHIIDISEISIEIINKRLVYVVEVPVLEHDDLQTLHLIPVPIHQGNGFIAPIPSHEIILTNLAKSLYVPIDFENLKSCKNIADLRIVHNRLI